MRDKVVQVAIKFNKAREELVYAIIILESCGDTFKSTVDEVKKTIGDLTVSCSMIEDAINKIDFPGYTP